MEEENKEILYVSIDDILPNRFQPRLAFDEKELNKLASSINKYGIIQPIVLRSIGDKYEIIAGERRYKASVLAGLKKVPAIIKNADDNTSAEIALLENLQRKNLTPIEEAQSFNKLLDRGFTQEDIAKKLGISQSTIANKIRLLALPKKVQDALLYGRISERHARSLLTIDDEDLQIEFLDRIVTNKLTVKQTEDEINERLNRKINIEEEQVEEIQPEEEINIKEENISKLVSNKNVFTEELEKMLSKNENLELERKTKTDDIPDILEIKEDQIINKNIKDTTIPREIEIANRIKDYITDMGENKKITINEYDLDKRYQIIIEIEKDS